jgi:hypothetical protein
MPELHPGPDASLGALEAQLRELGLDYNVGYTLTTVNGQWVLRLSDENYQRWQEAHGRADKKKSTADTEAEDTDDDGDTDGDTDDGDGDGDGEPTPHDKRTTTSKSTRRGTKRKGR